jgi:hypothetical protein
MPDYLLRNVPPELEAILPPFLALAGCTMSPVVPDLVMPPPSVGVASPPEDIVTTAEAIVAAAPASRQMPFPRSPVELRVLEVLQALSPMPATSIQVAALVNVPPLEVRTLLQALAMLETIEHPHHRGGMLL